MTLFCNNLVCRCYFVKNYFIKTSDGGFHIDYLDKEQLLSSQEFQKITHNSEPDEVSCILNELDKEKSRRINVTKHSHQRALFIKKYYIPKVPHIYTFDVSYLDEEFKEIVELCKSTAVPMQSILSKVKKVPGSDNIYILPIFTKPFCQNLVSEIENFQNSSMPKGRPNSMNNYGVSLEEMGFYERFVNPLRELYLNPICKRLYPKILKNGCLDSQKAFVVTYRMDADIDLDIHFDNSEVTCNISINTDFQDGELFFQGKSEDDYAPYEHELGWGLLHLGSERHGSMPISCGTRHNVIIWMRSSSVRNEICPMCQEKPHFLQIEGTGDGFSTSPDSGSDPNSY